MRIDEASARYVRWLEVARNVSDHTVRAYASDLALLERHVGESAGLESLSPSVLFAFLEQQRVLGRSPNTIRRRVCGVRGFCAWLVAEGLMEGNPWDGVRVSLRRARTLPRAIPRDELERLVRHLARSACVGSIGTPNPEVDKAAETTTLVSVAVMVSTGVRVGELVAVRPHDVDLVGRRIRIRGKGAREREVYLASAWLTELVERYLYIRSQLGVQHDRMLFSRAGTPLTTGALRGRLQRASLDAGLGRRITPHMLRHTAATQLVEAGVDIRFVQRLLGHASLATTERYTHVADHALRRVVTQADVLGNALRPA